MRNLGAWIETGGLQTYVGCIIGENEENARFSYAEEYLSGNIARPISIHLPLSENAFSVDDTRNFFEGLLPEGFTRRCVAGLLHTDTNNYLSLLAGLGNESKIIFICIMLIQWLSSYPASIICGSSLAASQISCAVESVLPSFTAIIS